ncbi:DNA-binding transcriptional LysR family regulator [Bradyrhizobium elkanii USDA 61]|uniref:DNA-binding transcriptional LysR family regulator n=2 Tax=Nitrobacteraceae TaxID=41294 RepID=A0A8I2C3Z3_BRAEL|nr:DNA-binding transcriptional LysR family regulator [Bradyrhizobium elkanii]MCS4009634.1 DNA-binding transcriptional LysR family regulator [Bradyrhizobium elkanii USDA 61]MCP1926975.1 DNA-binding transcriptional LysR family regulator [Bradyrhizobium elkanii]MCS3475500.1 DNA-binding transcriptional LysR family regulator [Bradyrhizobium elkanii]MCS3582347.1 DNA-binding transcriptional LysR family regulator [Bradyrhizobium elkanii]
MACSLYRTMQDFDLRDLDAFVAVARTRNFRRAALEQRVSVSSLSQRLRDMEERLGVRLMNRTTRSVALTEAGELLLARVAPAMVNVADAITEVRGLRAEPSGRLRINAPPPAVDLVLAPMIAPFLARYPRVELDVVAESAFVDVVAQGFDAGVRYGEHLAQDMVAVPLGAPQRYAIVASSAYVAKHGRPMHPKDLLAHPCIRSRFSNGVMFDWEFEKNGRVVKISPPAKLTATHLGLALRAVHDGVGYWATFEGYVRYGVKSGALVSVLDDWCPPFDGPFLYYPSRRQPPPALAAFVSFVADWRKQARRKK